MKRKSYFSGIAAAIGMLVLILDSRTAVESAIEGIRLCLWTVIPALFPFFILSGILVGSLTGASLPLLTPLGHLLGMPEGTQSLLISGFLGGYPVGAKALRDAWASGALSREDASRMLSFCNNAGPAFVFGMVSSLFSDSGAGWALWGIHIASALITGIAFRSEPEKFHAVFQPQRKSVPISPEQALHVTGQVCGWVIIFRILCAFLEKWFLFLLPDWGRVAIVGFLELTNGCSCLRTLSSEDLRFLICSVMLAFGGVCVLMQTICVTEGLSIRYYLSGKLVQAAVSFLLAIVYVEGIGVVWLLPFPLLVLLWKTGKRGRNPGFIGV